MPSKRTRSLALVVVLTAVLGMAPWLITAEGKSSQLAHAGHATPSPAAEEGASPETPSQAEEEGAGLRYQHDEGAGTDGSGRQRLEVYSFVFDDTAYIPERRYPEAMVVQVESGRFSICVGDEDLVIVDPGFQDDNARRQIPILRESSIDEPSCDLFSRPDPSGDVVRTLNGYPCTQLCALPPGKTVRVEEGATVYLPKATTCFWCNVTGGEASLRVFPVLPQVNDVPFSWTTLEGINPAEAEAFATPEAEAPNGARYFHRVTLSGLGVGCM